MLDFTSDYNQGAHPKILQRLVQTNFEKVTSYGFDKYSESAKDKIRTLCQCENASVFFLVGGTQTNQNVIASLLHSYEGVVAAATGHVNAHEAGAIELCGHKVIGLEQKDGKLSADTVEKYVTDYYADESFEHIVKPAMVYISFPTEYGTIYSKEELSLLRQVCDKFNMSLYIDGARLGYALMCDECDVTMADIARLSDVFYIGGTKVGALCGEAVVFTKDNLPERFLSIIKQHGALLAKGRLTGVQFDTLFTDNLYFEISRNAIEKAARLKDILKKKGYTFFIDSPTNQIFIALTNERYEKLKKEVNMSFWERPDSEHTVVRFATSWATTDEDIDQLEIIL